MTALACNWRSVSREQDCSRHYRLSVFFDNALTLQQMSHCSRKGVILTNRNKQEPEPESNPGGAWFAFNVAVFVKCVFNTLVGLIVYEKNLTEVWGHVPCNLVEPT
jgi:hypothetical protein